MEDKDAKETGLAAKDAKDAKENIAAASARVLDATTRGSARSRHVDHPRPGAFMTHACEVDPAKCGILRAIGALGVLGVLGG